MVRNDRNNKKNIRNEKSLTNYTARKFRKLAKYISKRLKKEDKQVKQKILNDVDWLIKWIITDVVDKIVLNANRSIKNWNKYIDRTSNLWVSFNVINTEASKYLEKIENLHLSERKWSILLTTKKRVFKIIDDGIKIWSTYTEIANEIIGQVWAWVFSQDRAKMIAIREVWNAYEFGKFETIKASVKETWRTVEKFWQTAEDDKVTPSHTVNQNNWWIWMNKRFTGTWDKLAPASDNPRCRCTILYRWI